MLGACPRLAEPGIKILEHVLRVVGTPKVERKAVALCAPRVKRSVPKRLGPALRSRGGSKASIKVAFVTDKAHVVVKGPSAAAADVVVLVTEEVVRLAASRNRDLWLDVVVERRKASNSSKIGEIRVGAEVERLERLGDHH